MKVTLKIENDAELRAYIKDCVRGQVLAITRGEFLEIVREELERKIKSQDRTSFDRMVTNAVCTAAKDILRAEHKVGAWDSEFIRPHLEHFINESIKRVDWDRIVNDLAKQKIQQLVK